jgi:Holliday junction resolvase RusA-like endonuclease
MTQYFALPVEPVAKGRPRVVRLKNGASHTFTPDKTVDGEERIRWHLKAQNAEMYAVGKPLEIEITLGLRLPKSASKRKIIHPTKRPDCDQYVKLVLDACSGILFVDDSQVVKIIAEKCYSLGEPYTHIAVREYE